jgi:3-deoxy-D-manno-octulosonic acid kinase
MIIQNYGKYRVGADMTLSARQMENLKAGFDAEILNRGQTDVLGGRSTVIRIDLAGVGPVVVKPYTRGGFIRRFIHRTYLRTGSPRCLKEYVLLGRLQNLGLRVPSPVAFAYAGALFYHAWLITKEIQNAIPLAGLGDADPARCERAMRDMMPQLATLVENRILHVDLHPGNVLVDIDGRAYLIDFDKARKWRWGSERLRRRYRHRWQRAVVKHGLPKILFKLPV